jgi:hypothetical protein
VSDVRAHMHANVRVHAFACVCVCGWVGVGVGRGGGGSNLYETQMLQDGQEVWRRWCSIECRTQELCTVELIRHFKLNLIVVCV